MEKVRPAFLARWGAFTAERFPPLSHLTMGTAFFAGNTAAAIVLAGARPRAVATACAVMVTLRIFFRLRVFDEIKDSKTDRSVHPDRPLARGLISPAEAKRVAFLVALVEMILALVCGLPAFVAWMAVFAFSLLMFREFFVGQWLRPKMELYALTHTLVAGWMGLFVAAAISDLPLWRLPRGLWGFALANWAVFNVFEFARKTWAPEEETAGVESYSNRLGRAGAALLTMGQVAVAAAAGYLLLSESALPRAALWSAIAMLVITGAASLLFLCNPRRGTARLFRGTMAFFIIGYYLALVGCILGGRSG